GLPRIAEMLLNAAMLLERAAHIQAGSHERTGSRTGYANGFKPRGLQTSLGALDLRIPQVRDCEEPFRTSLLETGSRIDRALKAAIAEMYLQGVSTRRVTEVMKKLCGLEVTSTQVSRLTAELDAEFEKWRNRPLPAILYLILDATYIKVRLDGAVRDCAVLTAIGVCRETGKRMVLGVSAAISEAEPHWRKFLASLKARGIGIPDLVTSDAHEGLKAALRATLNATPWQRCQFHLQQNAQAYVPNVAMRKQVAADIRSIFNCPDRARAEERLAELVEKHRKTASKLADWMETNIPEGLTVFQAPEPHRRRLRTSNMSENLNLQIKRRTRVAGLFPNEASVLRLVTAILMETSEEWETGRAYLSLTTDN
ncbi:IS256 family transposase, partial [Haloferula sp. A504]|uniref:IS256 family transposase n=1 Tax=Haloferula sp. A504 TaxID=3373601 RepID=UPI0031CBA82C|nr:IS256 family transposase [Verrucomicrobiaceae bacterium E54]